MSAKAIKAQINRLMRELEAMTEGDAPTVNVVVLRIKLSQLRRELEQFEGLSR